MEEAKAIRTDAHGGRKKILTIFAIVLLTAVAALGWAQAASNAAQTSAVCQYVLKDVAASLIPLQWALRNRNFSAFERSSSVSEGLLGTWARCPTSALDDQLSNLLFRTLEIGASRTGFWDNGTALDTMWAGLREARNYMFWGQEQGAIDRLNRLLSDLEALGFHVP